MIGHRKFAWKVENLPPTEWFDLDREENIMEFDPDTQQNTPIFDDDPAESAEPDTLAAAIERARAAGFTVETYEIVPGTTGYQLRSPNGEYVQFGGSEGGLWKSAFRNGHLPRRI